MGLMGSASEQSDEPVEFSKNVVVTLVWVMGVVIFFAVAGGVLAFRHELKQMMHMNVQAEQRGDLAEKGK